MPEQDFVPFGKISRLSREMVVTENLDGTNAQVAIEYAAVLEAEGLVAGTHFTKVGDVGIRAGSRNRWITPLDDNYNFAKWVLDHRLELATLGVGRHFGEWWGSGIQRNYGLKERRFSLFNVGRWCRFGSTPGEGQFALPPCVSLVPVLRRGIFNTGECNDIINILRETGSVAEPGFNRPEGIVIYHTQSKTLFKKTCENDESAKSAVS